jgi:BMFP domain-containing protein YqiC
MNYSNLLSTAEQLEEILIEAGAYGMRNEVEHAAKQLVKAGYNRLDAYQSAFEDLIKETTC